MEVNSAETEELYRWLGRCDAFWPWSQMCFLSQQPDIGDRGEEGDFPASSFDIQIAKLGRL